jgi:hypothetical protein
MPTIGDAFNLKFISVAGSFKQGNIRFTFLVIVQIDVAIVTIDGPTGNTSRNNVPTNKRLLVGTFLCAV